MSSVTPPTHIPPPPSGSAGAATAIAVNAPQAVQTLTSGQALNATLMQQMGLNQIRVETPLGPMTLQTAMALPRGAQLVLLLSGQTPQPTFQIASVNGRAVGGAKGMATAQAGQTGQTGGSGATAGTSATPPMLTPGQTVTATLVRPATGQAAPSGAGGAGTAATAPQGAQGAPGAAIPAAGGSAPSQAPTGGPSAPAAPGQAPPAPTQPQGSPSHASPGHGGTVQGGQAQGGNAPTPASSRPAGPTAPSTPAPTGGKAAANTASAPNPAQSTGAAPSETTARPGPNAATLATGTRFRASVQRLDAPGTAQGAIGGASKPLAHGQVLTGQVTGRTPAGQPIVQTPGATFALSGGSAARGAQVTFRLDTAPLPPLPLGGEADSVHGTGAPRQLMGARAWSDMDAALRTLAQADPARLAQVAQNALPQPGAKLSNQMLFFLSALKGGNLRGLFGDASMRILETERPDLAQRMATDFQTMARLVDEPQTGDWRLALIPLWSGEKLEQLRLFWRQGGGDGGEPGDDGEETRFVLDVDLSRMGHMQIDGLVKAQRQQLDLIVRSDTPLPDDMQSDIGEIFAAAGELTGLSGQLGFQAAPGNFVDLPEPKGGADVLGQGLLA